MSRNRRCGKSGFAIGAIFGGLVGGAAALLFAPKSGEKIRKDLVKHYQTASDKTCELIDGVCEQTCDLVEKAKDIATDAKKAASRLYRRD